MSKKLTIELSEDLAIYAQAKVASGGYGSMDEAVEAAMRGLKAHDDFIDRWVKEDVIPSCNQWIAGGEPTLTEAEVDAAIAEAALRKAS